MTPLHPRRADQWDNADPDRASPPERVGWRRLLRAFILRTRAAVGIQSPRKAVHDKGGQFETGQANAKQEGKMLLAPLVEKIGGSHPGRLTGLRKIVAERRSHDAPNDTSRRSRSAANARQAQMPSRVKSGKSSRISCSDMPEAR